MLLPETDPTQLILTAQPQDCKKRSMIEMLPHHSKPESPTSDHRHPAPKYLESALCQRQPMKKHTRRSKLHHSRDGEKPDGSAVYIMMQKGEILQAQAASPPIPSLESLQSLCYLFDRGMKAIGKLGSITQILPAGSWPFLYIHT